MATVQVPMTGLAMPIITPDIRRAAMRSTAMRRATTIVWGRFRRMWMRSGGRICAAMTMRITCLADVRGYNPRIAGKLSR